MPNTPRDRRTYYLKIRAMGLCGSCSSRPAEPGIARCRQCADTSAAQRKALMAAKLCVACKKPTDNGLTTCDSCSERERVSAKMSRKARKSAGLCVGCGGQPRPDRTLCAGCAKATADRAATHRKRCKKRGSCIKCGKMALMGITLCLDCRQKRINYKRKDKRDYREVSRRRRAQYAAAGLCRRCGKRPPGDDKTSCERCYSSNSLYARVHRFHEKTKKNSKFP